jgi:hypothetical protein
MTELRLSSRLIRRDQLAWSVRAIRMCQVRRSAFGGLSAVAVYSRYAGRPFTGRLANARNVLL